MGTVDKLLAEHVMLRLSCVDRIFLQGYVPQLQSEGMVVRFLLHRGYPIPSPAGLRAVHERLLRDIDRFADVHQVPVVHFGRKDRKEQVALPYLQSAAERGEDAVALIGVAQERMSGWRGRRTNRGSDARPHFAYRRSALWVNHYYFYVWDIRWGPGFVKICPYAPYPVWVWINGHEWLKRQLTAEGLGFTELDNGLRSVDDPDAAATIATGLSAGHVQAFCGRWLSRLPNPLTAEDRAAGYGYRFSVRQLEVSDTAVFDQPRWGRALFDAAIRDHLDLGRPENVRLVVDRRINRRTPGRFATKVVTVDVDPQLQIHYQSSKVKAYFKDSRALRVETTINNPMDFGIRKTLSVENWRALLATGTAVNRRFLAALGEGAPPPPDATTLERVVLPSEVDGLRAPGLRLGDPRVMALLAALAHTGHVLGGLTSPSLVRLMTALLGQPYTRRQAGYDLRRLRRKGLIRKVEHRNVYRITPQGRQIACYLTALAQRALLPGLTVITQPSDNDPPSPHAMLTAWRRWERELDRYLADAPLAA